MRVAQLRGHPRRSGRFRRVPAKHKRELSTSVSARDRRLGKLTALLAGCLLRADRPDEAMREARLDYLRDYMAKLIEALAAYQLGQHREARLALAAVGDVISRVKKQYFLGEEDADDLMDLWQIDRSVAPLIGVALTK